MLNSKKTACFILALVMVLGLFASCANPRFTESRESRESPTPRITESPSPRITESPNPRITESPTPRITESRESPNPRITESRESPTPRITESPTPRITESPTPRITESRESPSPRITESQNPRIDENSKNVSVIAEIKSGSVVKGSESIGSNAPVGKHNSRLCIPYDSKASYGISTSNWTTWGISDTFYDSKYIKSQISADVIFASSGTGQWMSAFFGLFKEDTDTIADKCRDGMYISFNPVASTVTAYIPNAEKWQWPAGNVTVNVDKSLISNSVHVDVLATSDKSVYVYLKDTLVMTVTYGSVCTVKDGSGKTVYTSSYDKDLISGDKFAIFSHFGGVGISNMKLYVERDTSAGPEPTNKPVTDMGLDITDKKDLVGICYSMWFNAIHGNGTSDISGYPHNVTEYTKKYGQFTKEAGFGEGNNAMTAFHYWGKPAQGYYRSSDKQAHRNNLDLIGKADVDFLILDFTYATAGAYSPGTSAWKTYIYNSSVALLDTIVEMRAEGKKVPYVVFWVNDNSLFEAFKSYFLNQDKWKDCFVYWNGKPFVLTWMYKESYLDDDLTIRGMYGLQRKATENQWSYLEVDNSKTATNSQMCVCVATQETYMSYPTAHGRNGGKFWYSQWVNAFKKHPKIVTVTWWNEWCAQLYYFENAGYVFTDNFNQEYSRDIEPMEGGHGDQYYKWLCSYVKAYKNGEECPKNYK